jgi:membrane protease YdiL (CAAX protease family)
MKLIYKGIILFLIYTTSSAIGIIIGLKKYIESTYVNGADIILKNGTLSINGDSFLESILKIPNISIYLTISSLATLILFIFFFMDHLKLLTDEIVKNKISKKLLLTFTVVFLTFSFITIVLSSLNGYKPTIGFNSHLNNNIYLALSIGLLMPLIEEIVFRYFILDGLQKITTITKSLILSSLVFSLVHFQYTFGILCFLFCFSLILGWFRWKSKSLLIPIILHSLNNILTLIIDRAI